MTCACGSGDLLLEVDSVRRVPADVDALRITITDVARTDVLRSLTVLLDKDFPVHILFTPGEDTPDRVRIEVEGRRGTINVNTVVVEAAVDHDDDTTVTVDLDD